MPVKRKSAYLQAAREAQPHSETVTPVESEKVAPVDRESVSQPQGEPVAPSQGVTVPQQDRKPVEQPHSATVKKDKKVTFYLTEEQESKLQDLEYELWKRHKKKINRNDIVRYLIDQVTADNLADLA